jgi:tetratricopeptide (TPR) repeat protein
MNDGFMHPAYPEQVIYSYYQASLVCDLLARDYGDSVFVKMLRGYKDGLSTDDVFKRVLNTDIKTFDKKFDDYLRTRFAAVLPSITEKVPAIPRSASAEDVEQTLKTSGNDFNVLWIAGAWMFEHDSVDRAIQLEQRAAAMFPEFGNGQSPYAILAAAYQKKGDTRNEADALTKLASLDESDFAALDTLSSLLEKLGDTKEAVDALDRAVFVNPFEPQLHQRLATLAQTAGDKQMVVRERSAVVALGPVDKADAYYQLALAQHDAGDDVHARTSVLRALEDAPNYEKAQTLLLTLYDARAKQAGEHKP